MFVAPRRWLTAIALIITVSTMPGCVPRTFVRKNPLPNDRGIRYYRPKPCLKVAPFVAPQGVEPSSTHVQIDLVYMPDYSEEYSIHICSGLGVNETAITLDQGWNLTHLNAKLDSQTDENVAAVGSLLGNIPTADRMRPVDADGNSFVVCATNVPMGFYEAVIGPSTCGKQLYGFRYVGFLPFSGCPTAGCGGVDRFDCRTGGQELYGLVFENGVMTFKPISEIHAPKDLNSLNRMGTPKAAPCNQPTAKSDTLPEIESTSATSNRGPTQHAPSAETDHAPEPVQRPDPTDFLLDR